jgi:glycosyltransferase involved in cell wall biosynthesis
MMVWLDDFWPDVVLVNCLPQLKGAAAARALGLPVVWHIREILPPGARRRWFARRLRRDASRIVAVSRAVADWLADEGLADRVEVVHNGCQAPAERRLPGVDRARFGLPDAGVLVGFFAQLIDHKGVFDLVEAGVRAMADEPSLGVVFAGEGPAAGRLRDAVDSSPYPDRFFVLPPQPDVWDLLRAVDVVAVPSLWPDPLPRTVMEAMVAGLPVVAYDTGGVPEMVVDGESGFLTAAGDVSKLAEKILQLSGDRVLRARMGAAAAQRAGEGFSLDAHTDRMERVFSRVVERSCRE